MPKQEQGWCHWPQNVPSVARVAAGAFGFLIFSHAFDGPERYGALSFFENDGRANRLRACPGNTRAVAKRRGRELMR